MVMVDDVRRSSTVLQSLQDDPSTLTADVTAGEMSLPYLENSLPPLRQLVADLDTTAATQGSTIYKRVKG